MQKQINSKLIGTEFEKEALKILKEKYDEVQWLSEKCRASLDFRCVKDNIVYFGDAKVCISCYQVQLRQSQKDADFVIVKRLNGIEFIEKKDFGNKVKILNDQDMTTIQVTKKDRDYLLKLSKGKYYRGINVVVEKIADLIKNHKLEAEL